MIDFKKCDICTEPFPVPYSVIESAIISYLEEYGLIEDNEIIRHVDIGLPIDEDDCVEVDLVFDVVGGC